jgi:hypothetical protein
MPDAAFNAPTLRKKMIICKPIGEYVNGKQKGAITSDVFRMMVQNQKQRPRQIPVYLNGDHPQSNDERPADGWVEAISVDAAGNLVGDVKLIGTAAELVATDRLRGASIYAVNGKSYDGAAVGPTLKHLLLTDEGFVKDLNIAASQQQGEAEAAIYFTALQAEADMADDKDAKIARLEEELSALKAQTPDEKVTAQLAETQALLAEKARECEELIASNENLKGDVEKFKSPKAIEELQSQLKAVQRQNQAEKIRRLVGTGVAEGQFNRALVGDPKTGYAHPSDEIVLAWFNNARGPFKGSMDRLSIMLETMPKQKLRREYGVGEGADVETVAMTEQEKAALRSQGFDPDKVAAGMKATGPNAASDYAAAVVAA